MDHNQLLLQAKHRQKDAIKESEGLSQSLTKTLETIVKQNSINEGNNVSSVLDKITTIHQIDAEINKQIGNISSNFEGLLKEKRRLIKVVNKIDGLLDSGDGNLIDNLQKRVELVDQELRVLEVANRLLR